jgi:hypothetical protein
VNRLTPRTTRLALMVFAASALTALGCSLIVEFEESRIPAEDTGVAVTETGTTDTGTPPPDTTMDDTGSMSETTAETSAETSVDSTVTDSATDTVMPDTVVVDTAMPDTVVADTFMPDTVVPDTTVADTDLDTGSAADTLDLDTMETAAYSGVADVPDVQQILDGDAADAD